MTAAEPFDFYREHDGSLTVESAVFQALGAASVCWESMAHTGIFDDRRAAEIGRALLEQIRALCDEREHGPGPGWIPVDEVRAILALGHPVEGVTITLTPEEAADLVVAVSVAADRLTGDGWAPRLRALVVRLEAAQ